MSNTMMNILGWAAFLGLVLLMVILPVLANKKLAEAEAEAENTGV